MRGSRSNRCDVWLHLEDKKDGTSWPLKWRWLPSLVEGCSHGNLEPEYYLNWVLNMVQQQHAFANAHMHLQSRKKWIYKALSCYSDDIVLSQLLLSVRQLTCWHSLYTAVKKKYLEHRDVGWGWSQATSKGQHNVRPAQQQCGNTAGTAPLTELCRSNPPHNKGRSPGQTGFPSVLFSFNIAAH